MFIINDLHIGARRTGGTTPASREALRDYLLTRIQELFDQAVRSNQGHVVIAGDLFDDFEVDTRDFIAAYQILSGWLAGPCRSLTLIAGNHDHSPRGSKMSSFHALAEILVSAFGNRVHVLPIGRHGWVDPTLGVYAVAHCPNQDLFDQALSEVPAGVKWLLLHANLDNNFAVESDHSLNVSAEQAKAFNDAGTALVFAHEHQARTGADGWLVVMGNQVPTSIADCLGNNEKFAHVIDEGGLRQLQVWSARDSFVDVPWHDLAGAEGQFIRVSGTATAAQASDVVNTIAAFRQRSDAFVVSNAVRVEGIVDVQDLPEKFEAAKVFDVMEFILSHLDADEAEVVKGLLN